MKSWSTLSKGCTGPLRLHDLWHMNAAMEFVNGRVKSVLYMRMTDRMLCSAQSNNRHYRLRCNVHVHLQGNNSLCPLRGPEMTGLDLVACRMCAPRLERRGMSRRKACCCLSCATWIVVWVGWCERDRLCGVGSASCMHTAADDLPVTPDLA